MCGERRRLAAVGKLGALDSLDATRFATCDIPIERVVNQQSPWR